MKKVFWLHVCLVLLVLMPAFNARATEEAPAQLRLDSGLDATASHTGWWWEGEAKTGTGISIEQQGDRLYLAWYVYDSAGRPVWYSALMDGEADSFAGTLYRATGWPLEGNSPAQGYTAESAGAISLNFTSADEAVLDYNDGASHSRSISRFMSGAADARDIQGWWYDPDYEGMGVFIESRGGQLFAAWYNYREDGSPRWWITIGGFTEADASYAGELLQYSGGQTLTGDWSVPSLDASKGPVAMQFQGETATLQWQGFSYDLQRFVFGDARQKIIPDTGIYECYDGDYKVWPLPGDFLFGQDAQYNPTVRQLSYTNHGDGAVTDNVTGLMWMQSDDGIKRSWTDAAAYCAGLDLGGHSDWRLPDRHELVGLLNLSGGGSDYPIDPAIDSVFSCHTDYWTSNTAAGDATLAWTVYFDRGGGGASRIAKDDLAYVRCVQGN